MEKAKLGIEILEMALEMEKSGATFYEHLARTGDSHSDEYEEMAIREQEHEALLSVALGSLDTPDRPGVYPLDYYQCISNAAKCTVDNRRLVQEAMARGRLTDSEAREISIALEKDSIFLYSVMYSMAPLAGIDIAEKLATDEATHLQELRRMKSARPVAFPGSPKTTIDARFLIAPVPVPA